LQRHATPDADDVFPEPEVDTSKVDTSKVDAVTDVDENATLETPSKSKGNVSQLDISATLYGSPELQKTKSVDENSGGFCLYLLIYFLYYLFNLRYFIYCQLSLAFSLRKSQL
jgi:hypothetical protein